MPWFDFRYEFCGLKTAAHERQCAAMQPDEECGANEHDYGEPEEHPTIILHDHAELREMKENRSTHRTQREPRSARDRRRHKEQHARNQFDDSRAVTAPRFLA